MTERQTSADSLASLTSQIFAYFSDDLSLRTESGKRAAHDVARKLLPTITNARPPIQLSSDTLAKLLGLICSDSLDFDVRQDLLSSFWEIFRTSSQTQKRAVLASRPSISTELVETILSCGEYDFQLLLMETLTKFAMTCKGWRNVLSAWFALVSPTIAEAVPLLDVKLYDSTIRLFLNAVNRSQPATYRVHSLSCLTAASDNVEFKKHCSFEHLWVDCSPRTGSIRLSVDGGTGTLAIIDVEHSLVQSLTCFLETTELRGQTVECSCLSITLHPGLLLPFSPPISVSNLTIKFDRNNAFLEAEEYFFKLNYRHVYKVIHFNSQPPSAASHSTYSRQSCLSGTSLSVIEKNPSVLRCVTESCVGIDNACRIVSSTPKKLTQHQADRPPNRRTSHRCNKFKLRTTLKPRVSGSPIVWLTSCSTPEINYPTEANNNKNSMSVVINTSLSLPVRSQPVLTQNSSNAITHIAMHDVSKPERDCGISNTVPNIVDTEKRGCREPVLIDEAVKKLGIAPPQYSNDNSIIEKSPLRSRNSDTEVSGKEPSPSINTLVSKSSPKHHKHYNVGKIFKSRTEERKGKIRKPKDSVLKERSQTREATGGPSHDKRAEMPVIEQEPDPYDFNCQISDEPIKDLRKKKSQSISQSTKSARYQEEVTENRTAAVPQLASFPPVRSLSGGPRKLFTPGRDDLIDIDAELELPRIQFHFPSFWKRRRTKNDLKFIVETTGRKKGRKKANEPARNRYRLRKSKKITYRESSSSFSSCSMMEPISPRNRTAPANRSIVVDVNNNVTQFDPMLGEEPMEVEHSCPPLLDSSPLPPQPTARASTAAEKSANIQRSRSKEASALPKDNPAVTRQPRGTPYLGSKTSVGESPAVVENSCVKNDDGYYTLSAKMDDAEEIVSIQQCVSPSPTPTGARTDKILLSLPGVGAQPTSSRAKDSPNGICTKEISPSSTLISKQEELDLSFEKIMNEVEAHMGGYIQRERQKAAGVNKADKNEFKSLMKTEGMDYFRIREEVHNINKCVNELEATCQKYLSFIERKIHSIKDGTALLSRETANSETENDSVANSAIIEELSKGIRRTLNAVKLQIGIKTLIT